MGRHAGGITEHLRLSTAIRKAGRRGILRLIADIKPVSPRDGDLVGQRDVADLARSLVKAGACALSVVTEPRQFGGCLEILRRVSEAVPVPVLSKDFLTAPEQVEVSSAHGAAAILLILATTPDRLAADLYRSAQNRGLEVVVEINTIEELQRALAPPFVTTTAVVGGPVEEMGPLSGWCALRGDNGPHFPAADLIRGKKIPT